MPCCSRRASSVYVWLVGLVWRCCHMAAVLAAVRPPWCLVPVCTYNWYQLLGGSTVMSGRTQCTGQGLARSPHLLTVCKSHKLSSTLPLSSVSACSHATLPACKTLSHLPSLPLSTLPCRNAALEHYNGPSGFEVY